MNRAFLLAGIAVTLSLLCLTTQVIDWVTGHESLFGLTRLFALDNEVNIPTWFSSILLFLLFQLTREDRFSGS